MPWSRGVSIVAAAKPARPSFREVQHAIFTVPVTMIPFLLRLVLLLFSGYALFRLWRDHRSAYRWINIVIAAGFVARAVAGQLMFWISYARLPVAKQLQMGDGLWFFARDALEYFPVATKLARSGVG